MFAPSPQFVLMDFDPQDKNKQTNIKTLVSEAKVDFGELGTG